jgi:hypothetical protein
MMWQQSSFGTLLRPANQIPSRAMERFTIHRRCGQLLADSLCGFSALLRAWTTGTGIAMFSVHHKASNLRPIGHPKKGQYAPLTNSGMDVFRDRDVTCFPYRLGKSLLKSHSGLLRYETDPRCCEW